MEEDRAQEVDFPSMAVYDPTEWELAFPDDMDTVHCPDPDCDYCNHLFGRLELS